MARKNGTTNVDRMNRTIGSIVAETPEAAAVFRRHGIDFCCGGGRMLGEAVAESGTDAATLGAELDAAAARAAVSSEAIDFRALSAQELVDHIEARHHAYLEEALPEISERLNAVLRAHGRSHPELFQVHGVYGALRTDLEQHLAKEETLLFPAVAQGRPDAAARVLAQVIRDEHTAAGEALRTLRRLTVDFAVPDDACPTYRRLLKDLETLESDLFQHIHLENNLLLLDL